MNRVLALLKIDVKSLISAAIITAIISPLRPEQCDQQFTSQDNINMLSNTQVMGIMKVIILSKQNLTTVKFSQHCTVLLIIRSSVNPLVPNYSLFIIWL